MNRFDAYFSGKKITVMGLGLLGRGVGDVEFLARHGAELLVTDLKSSAELGSSLERLQPFSSITFRLGEHRLEDFVGCDFVLKAAGVPLDSPYIEEARKNGIPIKMSASWFAELAGIPTVGVTGTRGKTTVTYMLHRIMKNAGMRVLLGGNIRGVSTLALLDDVTPESSALMELDSWQLQGWGEAAVSPEVAVFTTFMRDHMNYYHGDLDRYFMDKAHIFAHQKDGDALVVGEGVVPYVRDHYGPDVMNRAHVVSMRDFPDGWTLSIIGAHNVFNAACARAASHALGITDDVIRASLEDFKGVPGRLEPLEPIRGIAVYNDATSTTPEAALVALEALAPRPVVLIMGGADKGLDMMNLVEHVSRHAKKVILLAGTGTERLRQYFPEAHPHATLESAVTEALSTGEAGDAILFSPAFASFGMFKNEYDRNDQFIALVEKMRAI